MNKIILFLLIFLTSCIFRPNYSRPSIDTPENWRVDVEECCGYANLLWWQEWGDPVLDDLIFEGLENNYDFKIAIARVDEYYARFRQVYAQLFPQFFGAGQGLRQKLSPETNFLFPPYLILQNGFQALLNVSYEIDIWGKLHAASDAALATYLSEVQYKRGVILTLVTSIARGYITLRQYDEQLFIAKATVKSFTESLELAQDRYIGGTTSELPVEQARSELDAAIIEMKQLEIQVAQQENLLSVLLGRNPGTIERGKILEALIQPPCIPAGIPSEILEQRPDVMAAEFLLISAHSNVGVAKANMFPSITLTGFYGNQSFELNRLFQGNSETWQIMGATNAPLLNGGSYLAAIDQATAVEREALYYYHQVILTAFKEVNDALIAHKKSLELLEVQKDQVKALKKYLELAQLEYDNGQVDYLNVLDAQRNLFSSALDLVAADSYTYQTLVDVYKALGGGWVIDLDRQKE